MLRIYFFAGVLLALVIILKTPWFKGWIGELQINLMTRLFLNKRDYHLIKNVIISAEEGTTQIDHIIVSPL